MMCDVTQHVHRLLFSFGCYPSVLSLAATLSNVLVVDANLYLTPKTTDAIKHQRRDKETDTGNGDKETPD